MKTLKRYFIIGCIIFILSVIWEFSHHSLYIDLSGIPKYPHLIIASFIDMLIILGIFAIVSLKNKKATWIKSPSTSDYLLVVFWGITAAMLIEVINISLGRWKYTPAMPTVLGVGISPLIQLALTGILSLIIIRYVEKE